MDLLLTGATGFLGTHFVRKCGATHRIYALAREAPAAAAGVTWIRGDLARGLPADHLPPRVDAVMHLAQSRHDRDFPAGARDVFAVNVHVTLELLEYARTSGAKRFVLASSGGVYGTGPRPFRETDALHPPDFYLTSKQCAEALAMCYEKFLALVILRPFFIYGPGQSGRLIPNLAARIVRGEEIQVAGGEGPRLNPVYVGDVVNVLRAALRPDVTGTYNVAGTEAVSVRHLAEVIGTIVGSPPRFTVPVATTAGDLVADIGRLSTLGCTPRVGLEEGLRQAFATPQPSSTLGA
jgi:UDP-glucose 4-epimerase